MEPAVRQHLHSVTLRTLNANNFNRASSLAANTLTDVLAQYIALLALTAKQHAEQSRRDSAGVNIWDVLGALSEVGVSMEELQEYLTGEAQLMKEYSLSRGAVRAESVLGEEDMAEASAAARRLDSLSDIRTALSAGTSKDDSDLLLLEYRPVHTTSPDSASSSDSSPIRSPVANGIHSPVFSHVDIKGKGKERDYGIDDVLGPDPNAMDITTSPIQPPLVFPPSPVSNPRYTPPSSPSLDFGTRSATDDWDPPEHVPSFLPPFPGASKKQPDAPTPDKTTEKPPDKPAPPPRRVPLPLRPASGAKSSYTKSIPYHQSTLASKFGVLPDEISSFQPPPPTPSGTASKTKTRSGSLQPLIAAYHVLATDSAPATNPNRLKVAHILANTAPTRYSAPDTLFTSVAPPPPRFAAPVPTHAIPIPTEKPSKPGQDLPLPKPGQKVVSDALGPVDDLSAPWMSSNLPRLTRDVMLPHLFSKLTQLGPPPALKSTAPSASKDTSTEAGDVEVYHDGIPAPWNTSLEEDAYKRKDPKKSLATPSGKKLPDAKLFATWDWQTKQPNEPLAARRGRLASYATASYIGGIFGGGAVPLNSPMIASPALNGMMSPASAARGFVLPGPPASALKGRKLSDSATHVNGINGTTLTLKTSRRDSVSSHGGGLPDTRY